MKTIQLPFPGIRAVPFLFFIALLTLFPAAVRAEWAIERVDTQKNVGKYSSIAVDGDNRVHISYFSDSRGDLKYAKKDLNSPWVTATLDRRADAGLYTSIGVKKYVHISYYNSSNTKLRYADNSKGDFTQNDKHTWQTQDIDVAHNVGQFTSLAVDDNENAHISYYDAYQKSLKYATNAEGTWQVTTVDDAGDVGMRSSIGLDSAGRIHISYYDAGSGSLKYAARTENGTWQISTLNASGTVGGHIAIAVDERKKVHISYYDESNGDLKYTTDMSGAWVTEAVDSTDDVGQFTAIAVGPDRNIHISYYDLTRATLKYAVKKNPVSSVLPASVIFDSTVAGTLSAPQTLTVTNKGTGALQIGQIGRSGVNPEDFSIAGDTCSNRTLPSLETCTVDVVFAPQTAGEKSATVAFPSNDPETPVLSVPLSSTATAAYHIIASAGPGGSISPSGVISVNQGETWNFTMTPDEGFFVADLLVDGVSVGALTRYDFTDIGADHTIEVAFASPVGIVGSDPSEPVYYPSFQAAYSAIEESGIIRYQAVTLDGDLIFNRPVSVFLQGGYNFDFTSPDSFTTVNGTVVIEDGTLTVENLEIQ